MCSSLLFSFLHLSSQLLVSFAAFIVLLPRPLSFSLSSTLLFLDLIFLFLIYIFLSVIFYYLFSLLFLSISVTPPSSNLIHFSCFLSSFRTIILTGIHACCTKGNLRTAVIDLLAAPVSAVMISLMLTLCLILLFLPPWPCPHLYLCLRGGTRWVVYHRHKFLVWRSVTCFADSWRRGHMDWEWNRIVPCAIVVRSLCTRIAPVQLYY